MRLHRSWTPHTVKIAAYEGEGANGPIVADAVDVADVYVKDVAEVVVDSDGAEVVSRATVRLNLDDTPPIGSLVTIWPGMAREHTARVFKVSHHEHPQWPGLGTIYLR